MAWILNPVEQASSGDGPNGENAGGYRLCHLEYDSGLAIIPVVLGSCPHAIFAPGVPHVIFTRVYFFCFFGLMDLRLSQAARH